MTDYGACPDLDPVSNATVQAVQPYTMTSTERIFALCQAVRYISRFRIPGAVVECGVWRGGSMMAAARTLLESGDDQRDLYMFDTFEGMSAPQDVDQDIEGQSAVDMLEAHDRETSLVWAYAALEDVQANLASTGYDPNRMHFVRGMVEDTIPDEAPEQIALLRLDTDWYESTRHELEHLVERVSPHGVLIIDDYGHWQGARRAVDEFIATSDRPILLNRIDYTGRIAVLP